MFDDVKNQGDFGGAGICPLCQEPLCEECGGCHDCEAGEEEPGPALSIKLTVMPDGWLRLDAVATPEEGLPLDMAQQIVRGVDAVLRDLNASGARKRAARRGKRSWRP
jgi:hypothetical protein